MDNENHMVFDVKKMDDALQFIKLLISNNQVCVVRFEECFIVVEYDNDATCNSGNKIPVWLSPTERESVTWDSELTLNDEDSNCKGEILDTYF